MNQDAIAKIIAKHLNDQCDESEKELLQAWLLKSEKNQKLVDDLMCSKKIEQDIIDYNLFDTKEAWNKISSRLNNQEATILKWNSRRILYAASIILLICSVSFIYMKYSSYSEKSQFDSLANGKILKDSIGDILPATTGAILVTASGEKVSLSQSFDIKMDGSIQTDGQEISQNDDSATENSYYELIVPKAKIIHFTMFDGTKVWVNANSRLRIPTHSFQNERRITILSGEAYFEVSKYQNSKFFVDSEGGTVEVLGTKFNVNTFKNTFRTTLVEGSVKLSNTSNEVYLTPNNVAYLNGNEFKVSKANVYSDLAWKNNIFYFNNFTIHRIAKQIEDWYGVRVRIGSDVAAISTTYSGELRRDVSLREVQKMLQFISGFDVRIEGDNLNID